MSYTTLIKNDGGERATADIARDGDVVFVVGTNGRRLRVYSLFLKNASPVFNAMLGPNYKEGHELSQLGSKEIDLPDDNDEAMEIIFNVIHGRNDKVQETLSPDVLLHVAVACDKYDCFAALAFAIQSWLRHSSINETEKMWSLAMVSVVLRRKEAFEAITSKLVSDHAGSYMDLARKCEGILDATIPLRTAAMLEEARSKLRVCLITNILKSKSIKCGKRSPTDTSLLRQIDHLMFNQEAISSVLKALDPDSFHLVHDEWGFLVSVSLPKDVFRYVSDNCKLQQQNEGGLCLRCARTGEAHQEHA